MPLKVSRMKIDASALRRMRYGQGSDGHTVSLLPGTWGRIEKYVEAGAGQYGSAMIDLAVVITDSVLHPRQVNQDAAIAMLRVALGESVGLLAVAGNLRLLAEAMDLAGEESTVAIVMPDGSDGDE